MSTGYKIKEDDSAHAGARCNERLTLNPHIIIKKCNNLCMINIEYKPQMQTVLTITVADRFDIFKSKY